MNKQSKRSKLSYFKKLALLRKLAKCSDYKVPEEYQSALLNAMSAKQFAKFYDKVAHFSAQAFEILLSEKNIDKFKVHIEKKCQLYPFNLAIKKNGSDDHAAAMIFSQGTCFNPPCEEVLIERSDKLFKSFIKKKDLPFSVFRTLVKGKHEVLLAEYFEATQAHAPIENMEILLFSSSLDIAKKAYIRYRLILGSTAAVYALKSGEDELCREVLRKRALSSDKEFVALFDLANPDFLVLAVLKLNEVAQAFSALSAFENDPYSAFKDYCFFNGFDISLIESGCEKAIELYLPHRTLTTEAALALIKTGNNNLIKLFWQNVLPADYAFYNAGAELLFKIGDEELKSFYEEKFGLPYTLEAKLIQDKNSARLIKYIEHNSLFSLNVARLMESDMIDAAKLYCEKYGLSELAATVLMKRGADEVKEFYTDLLLQKNERLPQNAEFHFIETGKTEQVFKYAIGSGKELCIKSVTALLNRGETELIIAYEDKFDIPEDATALFAQFGSREALNTFFSIHVLSDKAEICLVERGDCNILKSYFAVTDLCLDAEIKLMHSDFAKTGEAVRFYLDQYDLYDDAEVELVKLGDRAMLDIYIAKHPLGEDATALIISIF